VARALLIYHFKYDQSLRSAAQMAGEEYKRSAPVEKRSTPSLGAAVRINR
jgi:hypothetical protein